MSNNQPKHSGCVAGVGAGIVRGMAVFSIQVGVYRGAVVAASDDVPGWVAGLAEVAGWVAAGAGADSFRHRLVRREMDLGGGVVPVAIKAFARAKSRWRDADFRRRGSKAERSFRAAVRLAEHGVGTPAPLAFLDRWEGGRLVESYYLCAWEDGATNFRDELNRLYTEDPLCRRIMALMETVALAVADLHDAGVCHRDLGNQNIMLRRIDEDSWGEVRFIDLNRASLSDGLTLDERARDLSRIDLPSDFFRVFLCMYGRHQHPSAELVAREARYRRRFARHTKTRAWRHPVREARQRKLDAARPVVPRGRELWVWDDRSVQAVSTLLSRDRHAFYPAGNTFRVASSGFRRAPAAWVRYRDLLPAAFGGEVDFSGRIGLAVGVEPGLGGGGAGIARRDRAGAGAVAVLSSCGDRCGAGNLGDGVSVEGGRACGDGGAGAGPGGGA
jgi:tRNA A-37 threonylcarbamoyl transferase component Bud32